jgi:hypothetical protein
VDRDAAGPDTTHQMTGRINRMQSPVTPRPERATRDRGRTLLLALLVAATALTVHGRVLRYPFIMDDWGYLDRALTIDASLLLQQDLSPIGKTLYRPIWPLYFLFVGKVFGLNALATHVISLSLHIAASLMVVRVLTRLTGDTVIGWLSGILYASASFVHMDPLLWAAGIFESGSILLALVSIWCFLEGHMVGAAIAYAVGLLFKESVVFLPVLFVAIARFGRRSDPSAPVPGPWSIRRALPIVLVIAAYSAIKLSGRVLALPPDHPYAIRLVGPHVLQNILGYGWWSVQALFPSAAIPPVVAVGVFAGLVAALVGWSIGRRRRVGLDHSSTGLLPLTVWLFAALSPLAILPNHRYHYYLTPALPALAGLLLLGLRAAADLVRLPRRASVALMGIVTGLSVLSSFEYFRRIDQRGTDQPYVQGTNDLVRRGATVLAVRDGLLTTHPTLPPGALLLFKGADLWALNLDSAPRLWYGDPTIRVRDAGDLVEESGQWYLREPSQRRGVVASGGGTRGIPLAGRPVFLFELTDHGVVERPVRPDR